MSKYTLRVNALLRKTHRFVTQRQFRLALEYLYWWFEKEEKPTDLDDRIRELQSLHRVLSKGEDIDASKRMRELVGTGAAVWLKAVIIDAESFQRQNPDGIWLKQTSAEFFLEYARCRLGQLRSADQDRAAASRN